VLCKLAHANADFCSKMLVSGYISQKSKLMEIDKIDTTILAELSTNARVSMVDLATRVGLSSTAIARRQRSLEENGFIQGYQAVLDLGRFGLHTTVLVRIALESQSELALKAFEAGVLNCPSVIRCFLMSGSDDYVAIVLARDIEDFERIRRAELSRLPRVARIQSSFAMRDVVNRTVPPVVFGKSSGPKRA
jgi:Lrp/AsnC family transcriptional regulator, leucine-responsive regulatory protein